MCKTGEFVKQMDLKYNENNDDDEEDDDDDGQGTAVQPKAVTVIPPPCLALTFSYLG